MSRFARAGARAASALVVALLAGCGGGSDATVSGEVLVDGQPLKKGRIKFTPADTKRSPVEVYVTDGRYTAEVPVGEATVQIYGDKVVGRQKMYDTPDSPVVEKVEELVDEAYNVRSNLKMTVQKGSQEKKWEVRGRK
jgi:hypothetical protein